MSSGTPQTTELPAADRANIQASIGKLPLSFIENRGQADERIAYYIQSPGRSLYFIPDGHALCLTQGKGVGAKAHTITVELIDAKAERIEGLERAPGIVSYFKGPKENWKTAIPTHSKIGYVQPWPGIDLSYDGTNGALESIYTVAPHADPSQIKLRYSGQDSLKLDGEGNLVYSTVLGEVMETAPILYQEIDGARMPVEGRYVLLDETTVAFQIAEYDSDHALIIDPTLVYAGFIGGSGDDIGAGIAVDGAGNAYVTGYTNSNQTSFPVLGGPDITHNGGTYDAFVAKVNAAGTALVYAGFIGGSGDDIGAGIAVDGAGNAYVTGYTDSDQTSFPVLGGPNLAYGDGYDAFVAKVNAAGTALVYAGYLGGSGDDYGAGIAVDGAGNAYVTGYTDSDQTSFPVLGGPNLASNGFSDALVAKISATAFDLAANGNSGAEVTLVNPVTLTYSVAGCQDREMYLVLNAPAMGIAWSYLNWAGSWLPLPANLADITPFNSSGPADGGYTLYSGSAPLGDYELYLGCDFVTDGRLDYTGGTTINAVYDHIIVHVR